MSKHRLSAAGSLLLVVLLSSVALASPQVQLAVRDGAVYLTANDVPLQELLRTWEAQTGTKILFAEGLPNERVTLELLGVSEREALGVLLRPAVGYLVGARSGAARPGQSLRLGKGSLRGAPGLGPRVRERSVCPRPASNSAYRPETPEN